MAGKKSQVVTPLYGPIGAVNSPKSSQISGKHIISLANCVATQASGFLLTGNRAN